jgi:hypothetical protein
MKVPIHIYYSVQPNGLYRVYSDAEFDHFKQFNDAEWIIIQQASELLKIELRQVSDLRGDA